MRTVSGKGSGDLAVELETLRTRLGGVLGKAVVVFAVGGLWCPTANVVPLGDTVLFGHLTKECEKSISELCRRHVGRGFPISAAIDALWVEDYVAGRDDPDIEPEINARRKFRTPVLAIAVDAVGPTARQRALQIAESVLGAIALVAPDDHRTSWPPWVIGTPSIAENPQDPDLDEEEQTGLLSLEHLQVDSASIFTPELQRRPSNIDLNEVLAPEAALVAVVADAHSSGTDRVSARIAAACRFGLFGLRDLDPQLAVFHATIALESLVGDHSASGGVTARFVKRLSTLVGEKHIAGRLEELYRLRSDVAHTGSSSLSFDESVDLAVDSLVLCGEAIKLAHDLSRRQSLETESEFLAWLES